MGKGPFKVVVIFSGLRDCPHFLLNSFEIAQISGIIIDINLLKIKKIRQTLWEQEPF